MVASSPSSKCYYALFMFIRCLYGLQGVVTFLARSGKFILSLVYVLIKRVCLFFHAEKKTTNETNWSEVNKNRLHSLEVSLDLDDNSIIYSLGITTGLVCMSSGIFFTNSYPTLTSLGDH